MIHEVDYSSTKIHCLTLDEHNALIKMLASLSQLIILTEVTIDTLKTP